MKAKLVRELLRNHPDGLTLAEIHAYFPKMALDNLRRLVKDLPDSYVDRWEPAPRKQYRAVYCVVIPPSDCPHPNA